MSIVKRIVLKRIVLALTLSSSFSVLFSPVILPSHAHAMTDLTLLNQQKALQVSAQNTKTDFAHSVQGVESLMIDLDRDLPEDDGTRWFNLLYLKTTRNVLKNERQGVFEDTRFLKRFIVIFANLYFKAVFENSRDSKKVSKAWIALFENSRNQEHTPIQFAIAGLYAHISRDIPQALVETSLDLGITLRFGSPQHRDFLRINKILLQTMIEIKQEVGGICGKDFRSVFCQIDDSLLIEILARIRDKAFADGNVLWALKDKPDVYQNYLDILDESTYHAGRSTFIMKL